MRAIYAPEDQYFWEEHFTTAPGGGVGGAQLGFGLAGYYGIPYQRGYGLGSFFKGLFRMAVPVLKRVAKVIGKQALAAGANIAGDMLSGQRDFKDSLQTHGREAAGSALEDVAKLIKDSGGDSAPQQQPQGGSGLGERSKRKTTSVAQQASIKGGSEKKRRRKSRKQQQSPDIVEKRQRRGPPPPQDVFNRSALIG